jgi:hypothetical protein
METLRNLIRESLDIESEAPEMDEALARSFALQLRELFPNLHLDQSQDDRIAAALGADRWRVWQQKIAGALRVTVATGERSRIAVDQALDRLLATPMDWCFAGEPLAVRGENAVGDPGWSETQNEPSEPHLAVTVDDQESERTLIATLTNLPAAATPPLLLLYRLDDGDLRVIEANGPQTSGVWQYRARIADGEYAAVFGPR